MRFIQWGIRNPVFINLLMVIVLLFGIVAAFKIKRAMFPSFSINTIEISVIMEDGSSPDEIDKNIVQLLVPAIQRVDGTKEIYSTSTEIAATLLVEVEDSYDPNIVKQEIKDEIDTIRDFPEKALEPRVIFLNHFERAINIAIYGKDVSELALRNQAEEIKRDLENRGIATQVKMMFPRPLEISVNIPIGTLQAKNLTMQQVAEEISRNSIDLNAGEIRRKNQNIVLKGNSRKTRVEQLQSVPFHFPNGEFILLKDLVSKKGLIDGFSEDEIFIKYNGEKAVVISVEKPTNVDIIDLCDRVKEYCKNLSLPEGIKVQPLHDVSLFVKDRLNLIINNALIGLLLVITVLSLFLEWQTAFWTSMGIAFSLIGTLGIIFIFDQSLNMISLFAFLMTMGVVVDDAIVIAEGFFQKRETGLSGPKAADSALEEVTRPVIAMMCTTITAFIPLLFVSGMMGKFIYVLPVVVITALALSLFEALIILPAHLAHHSGDQPSLFMVLVGWLLKPITFFTQKAHPHIQKGLHNFSTLYILPIIRTSVHHRYATSLFFGGILIILVGMIPAGILKTSMFPNVDSDFHNVTLQFDRGTPIGTTLKATHQLTEALEKTGKEIKRETGHNPINEYFTLIGHEGSHSSKLVVELVSTEKGRKISGTDFVNRWRSNTPNIPNIATIEFSSARGGPPSKALELTLTSNNPKALQRAEEETLRYLSSVRGLVDIFSSNSRGARTIEIKMKDAFRNMEVDEKELISTIANIYQGIKVDTFYRNESEVKIYVRAPSQERGSLPQLRRLQLSNGMSVEQVADLRFVREAGEIKRVNTDRTITIFGNIDQTIGANAIEIRNQIKEEFLKPLLPQKEPEVSWSYYGEAKEGFESIESMLMGYFPALLTIYLILATIFRSYSQPLIIMASIPFGLIGAIIGHLIMGIPFNMLSGFGIVGLTGIAVNDSLILIDSINRFKEEGCSLEEALIEGARRRLRPILLTSLTTISGLSPVLLETSFQAQFLIPMVTSIVFGIAISTFLIIILIPVGYAILNDLQLFISKQLSSRIKKLNH